MNKNQKQIVGNKKSTSFFSFGRWSIVYGLLLGLWSVPGFAGEAVCFNGQCFSVEIADTPEKQVRGLQFRHSMPKDAGMLFVFERPLRYSFWMKDTLIALDMIWLDQNMTVVHIEENVSPCTSQQCESYSPPVPALYVLELNAGTASSINLKPGDRMARKPEK